MSESKVKHTLTQQFLARNPYCILCGGEALATTIEHLPPKIAFINKQWPETYEFPACLPCNNGSKKYDQLFGFLCRLGVPDKPLSRDVLDQFLKIAGSIKRNYPDIHKTFSMSVRDKRRWLAQAGWEKPIDVTYGEIPIVRLHEEFHEAIGFVAAKISKALYFKHTGDILPQEASIRFSWQTNTHEDFFDEEMLKMTSMAPINGIVRNNSSLTDQFDYLCNIGQKDGLAIFCCKFGVAFGFTTVISANPAVLEDVYEKNIVDGVDQSVMKRVYWPPNSSSQ